MVSRALSEPRTTVELLALGDYMLYANTTFMQQSIETVKFLSAVACATCRYAVASQEFWLAVATSVRWVRDVSPVFLGFSTMYEARKSAAEEHLTRVIAACGYDLDVFAPHLAFLDRIDDVGKIHEYKLASILGGGGCFFWEVVFGLVDHTAVRTVRCGPGKFDG